MNNYKQKTGIEKTLIDKQNQKLNNHLSITISNDKWLIASTSSLKTAVQLLLDKINYLLYQNTNEKGDIVITLKKKE